MFSLYSLYSETQSDGQKKCQNNVLCPEPSAHCQSSYPPKRCKNRAGSSSMLDRGIIELIHVAFLKKVNLCVKCRQVNSLQLPHVPFANVENGCQKKRDGGREEKPSSREMEDKGVEEEVKESAVTLDLQCPLCQTSF